MLHIIFKSTSVLPEPEEIKIHTCTNKSLCDAIRSKSLQALALQLKTLDNVFLFGHARRAAGAARRHKSLQLVLLLWKCSILIAHRRPHYIHRNLHCAQLQLHYSSKSHRLKCMIFVTGTASLGILITCMEIHGSGSSLWILLQ